MTNINKWYEMSIYYRILKTNLVVNKSVSDAISHKEIINEVRLVILELH